tara:strand:- start:321 stop:1208 length:888 start_codon:yes stop_codon:yes gene_type:complete
MKKKLNFYFDFLKKKFLEREINSLAKKYINQNYFRMATISYDGISNYTNIFGFYENETIITLKEIFKKNKINNFFIDVGANYGTYSIYFSKNFRKVYSIEAAPRIFRLLRFNCENFKNIKTFNFAVSDNQKSKFFYIDNKNFGANSLIKKRFNKRIKVKCDTLDRLIKKKSIKNSFIKIDTEGSEINVLKGMKKIFKSKNLIIGIEQLSEEFYVKEKIITSNCVEFLKKNNFKYFYEITINDWRFNYVFFSKLFKILEIIFFIKPYTKIEFKRVRNFEKKIYQQIICSKENLKII